MSRLRQSKAHTVYSPDRIYFSLREYIYTTHQNGERKQGCKLIPIPSPDTIHANHLKCCCQIISFEQLTYLFISARKEVSPDLRFADYRMICDSSHPFLKLLHSLVYKIFFISTCILGSSKHMVIYNLKVIHIHVHGTSFFLLQVYELINLVSN